MQGDGYKGEDTRPIIRNGKYISVADAIHMDIVSQQRDARRAEKIKTKGKRKVSRNSRRKNRK